jgi:hypothetical protein
MYIAKLSFDFSILKMYTRDNDQNNIRPLQELKQLWDDSSNDEKIMTFKVTTYICQLQTKKNLIRSSKLYLFTQ